MADKLNKKRERGANYTPEEKTLLVDLIMRYKHIIEDKSTGGHILNKKKDAWREITVKYNSNCTTGSRQMEQMKALYDNMKQKSRKNVGNKCLGQNKLLVTTPSNVATPSRKSNNVAGVQKIVKKQSSAEALKRIYFKKKCENAYLERKKLMKEMLNMKEEHNLKMIILKKKLDNLNKC